jgi:intein-encoded DNA endonuclease-like protein
LIDDKLDPKDTTSLIYRWASNKYIKICAEDDKNKKFYIEKLKNLPDSAKEYQKKLFKKLFSDGNDFHFSGNKSKFQTYLSQTETDLTNYIDGLNRYKCNFSKVGLNAYSFKSGAKTTIFWIAIIWILGYCFTVT